MTNWPNEVKSVQELEMPGELTARCTGTFEIDTYRDSYRESLAKLIEAKQEGHDVHGETAEAATPPSDF